MQPKPCNGCIGCCLTMAVRELGMRSFTRCEYVVAPPQHPSGCEIYPDRPTSCALWRCRWQTGGLVTWPEELRPDRCGVVFETVSEVIKVAGAEVPVVEAYVIPGRDENAFENNPAVRRVIVGILVDGYGVLWRMRGDKGPKGPERVRVIMLVNGEVGVGPVTDTIEAPVSYENYTAVGNRLARRERAEALARERTRR